MMEALAQFHFLRPAWLLLILPAVLLAILLMRQQARPAQWAELIAPHLLPYLIDGQSVKARRYPLVMLLIMWVLGTLALAGPTWSRLPEPVHEQTSALVIAWDLSPSMMAQDLTPSRLVRARLKLIDLLKVRKEGLTALIAYSGEAHVVTPLTDDTRTIISLLNGLDPAIMPAKGSNVEMAMELANQLFKDGGIERGHIVFLTDGIDDSATETLVQLHENQPHEVTIWGIGTPEGAPIPLAGGGFAYDRNRQMVIARLNDHELSDIAVRLGGLYVPFTQTASDLDTIMSFSFGNRDEGTRETERVFDKWYEQGPLLILLLLPFAALAFRRGWILSLAFIGFVGTSPRADALEWQQLWKNPDQRGQELLQEDPAGAAETFKNKDWQAIANYQAGDYEQALEGFQGDGAKDAYNRGNALAHLGKLDEAIEQFQQALEKDPAFDQAKRNLEIAEKMKELAEQQQQQQQQQPSQGESQNQQGGEQQNQQDGQQNDSQQNSDQQDNDNTQNSQNQSSSNTSDSGQQAEQSENSDQNEQAGNNPTDTSREQQEALEKAYGQQDSEKQDSEDQNAGQDQESSQQLTEQNEDEDSEKQQQSVAMQPGDEQNQQPEGDEQQAAVMSAQNREQQENQQALEQWLRKVPDDPSGLLRNKFRYEYGQRKHEMRQNNWRTPDNQDSDERW